MDQSTARPDVGTRRLAVEGGTPLYRGSHFRPHPIPAAGRVAANQVLRSGRLFRYAGDEVVHLERQFAQYLGVRFALAVSSASAAIHLALLATGLKGGDDVLVSAFTFSAVPSAVVHAQGRPVLVEVGANYRLDLADLEAKLTSRTRHLLLTHMRGHVADMDAIKEISARHGIVLIEDAAHALGALWDERYIGTLGHVGCYSFQSDKIINGGEGGLIVTDDEEVIVRATLYSGCYEKYWMQHGYGKSRFPELQKQVPLYNVRMTNLTAALISAQLDALEKRILVCARNHAALTDILSGSPYILLPPRPIKERAVLDTIQFTLAGLTEAERRAFVEVMQMEGVGLGIFGLDPDNARAFWNWEYLGKPPRLPQTEKMLAATCDLRLPATLAAQEVMSIGRVILDALAYVTRAARPPRSASRNSPLATS
jgi:perosamine synthetase